jgi:uncharacterized protein YcaQ
VRAQGEVRAEDFEHDRGDEPAGWWGWKPQKAALEYLWHTGELTVVRRVHFHKVYDLVERVLPEAHARPEPPAAEHRDWACRTALERLGVATPTPRAAFWRAIPLAEARAWCAAEVRAGRLLPVRVEGEGDVRPQMAYAPPDWEARLAALPEAPETMRLLCPFDPVLRDRDRALRLFGFDYRFEAFVPQAERKYGYYVLPILEGEHLVGRVDPKLHRERRTLEVRAVWWEPAFAKSRARKRRLEAAAWDLARWLGAERLEI